MHIPLIIAILALLAWTLLPQLDYYRDVEMQSDGVTSYLSRLAHWVNE
jgi:hypothetical protein